ncbi:MAG: hypothetical protein NTV80_08540 [Verrucomicrobia bacterium]|nr:hypothetical protein [Verrucomicrobiota bacterium]
MTSRLQNHLNMIGTCITVAQSPEHKTAWEGQEPADFTTDIDKLATDYSALSLKAAQAEAATGGAADEKAIAEATLENLAHVVARALANHFKKTGNRDRLGKVDYTKSELVKLRTQELVNHTTAIRDFAQAAVAEPDAAKRGITPARLATLSSAIAGYTKVMNAPRGQIINRNTLIKEVETDTAALLESIHDLDDLVLQFDTTPTGHRFLEAWKRARIIVDVGGGQGGQGEKTETPIQPVS